MGLLKKNIKMESLNDLKCSVLYYTGGVSAMCCVCVLKCYVHVLML